MQVPASLKPVTPYIRRAEELDRDASNPNSKTVAYFCRYYAVEQAMALRQGNDPEITQFLTALMGKLETDKAVVPNTSAALGKPVVENFAMDVFRKADSEDRAGLADKGTARTFYAAGNFFDVLQQFGDLSEEVKQMKKYAKWKAAEILQAIKEGRTPTPGGYGEEPPADADPAPSAAAPSAAAPAPSSSLDSIIPQAPSSAPVISSYTPAPNMYDPAPAPSFAPSMPDGYGSAPAYDMGPSAPAYTHAPAPAPAPVPAPAPAPAAYNPPRAAARPKDAAVNDTMELCQFAIAALKHNDVNLAADRLREALRRLGK